MNADNTVYLNIEDSPEVQEQVAGLAPGTNVTVVIQGTVNVNDGKRFVAGVTHGASITRMTEDEAKEEGTETPETKEEPETESETEATKEPPVGETEPLAPWTQLRRRVKAGGES